MFNCMFKAATTVLYFLLCQAYQLYIHLKLSIFVKHFVFCYLKKTLDVSIPAIVFPMDTLADKYMYACIYASFFLIMYAILSFIFLLLIYLIQDLPPISIKEVKTSDGAFCLQLSVSPRTRWRDGFWNFLDKFGFHYGDGTCRTLLPVEVFFCHISRRRVS